MSGIYQSPGDCHSNKVFRLSHDRYIGKIKFCGFCGWSIDHSETSDVRHENEASRKSAKLLPPTTTLRSDMASKMVGFN